MQKATIAKENSERQGIVENAKLDILAKLSEKKGEDLTQDELEAILISDEYTTQGILSSEENILERTLTSKDEKYQIPVSEIYNGNIKNNKQKTISFKIMVNGKEYEFQCIEGTTWIEWAESTIGNPIYTSFSEWGDGYLGYFQGSLQEMILSVGEDVDIWTDGGTRSRLELVRR